MLLKDFPQTLPQTQILAWSMFRNSSCRVLLALLWCTLLFSINLLIAYHSCRFRTSIQHWYYNWERTSTSHFQVKCLLNRCFLENSFPARLYFSPATRSLLPHSRCLQSCWLIWSVRIHWWWLSERLSLLSFILAATCTIAVTRSPSLWAIAWALLNCLFPVLMTRGFSFGGRLWLKFEVFRER